MSTDSFSFNVNMLHQLHDLCYTHITLANQKIGGISLNNLEVLKVNTMNLDNGNPLAFKVKKDLGMRKMPIERVKI